MIKGPIIYNNHLANVLHFIKCVQKHSVLEMRLFDITKGSHNYTSWRHSYGYLLSFLLFILWIYRYNMGPFSKILIFFVKVLLKYHIHMNGSRLRLALRKSGKRALKNKDNVSHI